ncbi:PREDICTED: peroxisome biosynthesis protein PAS1-like isoform X1 [Lupinus angustifolius]|uniref:peroxisome biosynthesis protein PAS1-like isoform X1 n=1 Tax=Lupinus angustifolius TaxID=3871 RepID=UPI00092E4ED5|nr:PREDICTED: peroxisome biosynthesis protein PAS1-like isoform X1 [Lupinus angustifolius]
MEQKHVLLSALSVGVGLGVGLGLSSGQKWVGGNGDSDEISEEQIVMELKNHVLDGKESVVTFNDFPYYLSERTRVLLSSAGYVHLKNQHFSKHTRNLSPASRAILLSGPTELYQQTLAKALAHCFESKLLLIDISDFSLKMQSKYGCSRKEPSFKRSISEVTLERMSGLFGSFSILPATGVTRGTLWKHSSAVESSNNPHKLRRNASAASDISSTASQCGPTNPGYTFPLKRTSILCFDEKLFVKSLYKVLVSISETGSIILYIRDVEKLILQSSRLYNLLQKMIKKLSGSVLILGSQIIDSDDDCKEIDERLSMLFPYNIEINPPEDEAHLGIWKSQLEKDMEVLQFQDNRNHIAEVLAANDIHCDDLTSICHADTMILSSYIEEIVVSALSYHVMNGKDPEYRNGKLVISANSLSHGLSLFQEGKSSGNLKTNEPIKDNSGNDVRSDNQSPENKNETEKSVPVTKKDAENPAPAKLEVPDNEFEKRIRPEVIPASEIGVTFADIGALDETKESLQELVMLPLRRPDLFKGGLLKPCRGILLFGPPGTGKTMLAKAIANEAGASFINVSMSTITSKWFGEDEKNVRALFTLAAKVAPTIIFVDEVDSMLGQRTRVGEHEAMRKIKNEFMTHWDGLLTRPGEQILVLAATNRPFDLDEAIIRRFERRIMVGLPSAENREMILKTVLAKEKHENLDFKELGTMTEGFSGSDLKNLCITAAYRPVRELIQQERRKDMEKKKKAAEGQGSVDASNNEEDKEEREITLRPLNMEDMRQAKSQVAASFASEGAVMSELKQWNDLYGEGGSRKKQQLTYFL